ncbi:hypothetical protein DH2020_000042 [Rehmannia glutinosa]|uniref:Uncharacterized protein n=1 Tax=Rehmannia glutinosa TaxID=99300 RepID=A0ABR0XVS8_REHGL
MDAQEALHTISGLQENPCMGFSPSQESPSTKLKRQKTLYHLGIEEDKVPVMCAQLYKEYGTTMAGLRIFSNGNEAHVAKVLSRLGLEDCFDDIICFETLNPTRKDNDELPKPPIVCKPFENSFEQAFKIAGINPQKTLFFDDSIRNLQTAKIMGLRTVWVGSSHRTKSVDYALESIHNMREALPELWEALEKSDVRYSGKPAIETYVKA